MLHVGVVNFRMNLSQETFMLKGYFFFFGKRWLRIVILFLKFFSGDYV